MKRVLFIYILFFEINFSFAQISTVIPSSLTIANASVAETHQWSAFSNPASIGFVSNKEFSFQYENRYFISELSTKSLGFVLPSQLINTSFSASYFGYSLYNEMLFGVGFSRNFSNKFSIGVQLNYFVAFFSTPNKYYGTLFPQVGLNLSLTPEFHLGFSSFNPFQSVIKSTNSQKRLPSVFSLGAEYLLSPELVFFAQADKEISSNYRFALGVEYSLLDFLTVKTGLYHTDYLVPCFGFKTDFSSFSFNLNEELHPLLGLVSIASLRYRFNK